MKRTITALLAAMLVLLSACGQTGTNDTQGSDPSSTSAPDTEPIAEVNPDARYPHETSAYGGKTFTILNCEDVLWDGTFHILDYEDQTGERIDDAIFNRARQAEERFEITFEVDKKGYSDLINTLNTVVMAAEEVYDAAYLPLRGSIIGTSGLNLYDIESLHLDDDWWHRFFIEEATLFGDTLFAMPDFSNMMGYTRTQAVVFNKKLLEDRGIDMPYDLVRSGEWTVDTMHEYIKQVVNLNGDDSFANSEATVKAVYGYGVQHEGSLYALMVGSGESFVEFDEEDYPVLREDLSALESVYSKLASIFSTDGYGIMKNGNAFTGDGSAVDLFTNGRLEFYTLSIGECASHTFRDLKFDYGILPTPKMSADQNRYYSAMSEYTLSLVVPITAPDPEMTGSVINYMSYMGKETIIPELEVAFCYKGLRDEDSIEMLEMIMNSIYLDFGYVQKWTSKLINEFASQIMKNELNFASTAKVYEPEILWSIDNDIKTVLDSHK